MEKAGYLRRRAPVHWLAVTAVFMAMNIALSSFGMPVPGGHRPADRQNTPAGADPY